MTHDSEALFEFKPTQRTQPDPEQLMRDLAAAINRNSAENGSDTPDFVLAGFLYGCLAAFDQAVTTRTRWYGDTAMGNLIRERDKARDDRTAAINERTRAAHNAAETIRLMRDRIDALVVANGELREAAAAAQRERDEARANVAELEADCNLMAHVIDDRADLRARLAAAERERDSLARRCAVRFEETEKLRERLATVERDALLRAAEELERAGIDAGIYSAQRWLRERAKAADHG